MYKKCHCPNIQDAFKLPLNVLIVSCICIYIRNKVTLFRIKLPIATTFAELIFYISVDFNKLVRNNRKNYSKIENVRVSSQ